MDFHLSRAGFGHDQRRRPADRYRARRAGKIDLERSRERDRPAGGAAALADRARAPCDLRRHAGAGREAPGRANPLAQSRSCRRLDRYRLAGHHRKRDPLRPSRRFNYWRAAVIDRTLEQHIQSATQALLACQRPDGHWVFELEADATIPAEYVLLRHYLGEPVDAALEAKIAVYLRRIQGTHGGWALFQDGDLDISATVKAYFALKMIGDSVDADHMRRAREAVRARGGAAKANVFTRIMLALFGFIPWRAVPVMPIEIMLLPKWFPFHLDKISYWSRTVIVPLLVLMAKKPKARNAKGVRIDELFLEPPETIGPAPKAPQQKASWFWFFRAVDNVLRATEPYFPERSRQRAFDGAVAWVSERLNGEDGLGAIFPAMANSVMMFDVLGYPEDHPQRAIARTSVERLLVVHENEAYCQPCVSPIWDTGLVCHALLEAGGERLAAPVKRGLDWLVPKQILDVRGDWIARRLGIPVRQCALSRRRRYRRRRHGDGSRPGSDRRQRLRYFAGAGKGMDCRHAERERRLGRVRCRQRILLSQQHPVRRSWRVARSADRGRHRALRIDAGAIRRNRRQQPRGCACGRLPAPHAACGGQLVRPLGHELHLRHLVGAVRAQCSRHRSRRAGNAQGGGLAGGDPE